MSERIKGSEGQRRVNRKKTYKKRGMTIKKKIIMTGAIFAVAFVGISAAVINVAHGKGDGYKKRRYSGQTWRSPCQVCFGI